MSDKSTESDHQDGISGALSPFKNSHQGQRFTILKLGVNPFQQDNQLSDSPILHDKYDAFFSKRDHVIEESPGDAESEASDDSQDSHISETR